MREEWQCNECGEVFFLSGDLVCPFCDSTDIAEYELEEYEPEEEEGS